MCPVTSNVFSHNKTTPAFDMNAANKTIQIQIRAFENVLKKRDAVALGKLYTTDAKFMNHGSPSTVGSSGGLNHFVTVDFNPPIETIILKKTP